MPGPDYKTMRPLKFIAGSIWILVPVFALVTLAVMGGKDKQPDEAKATKVESKGRWISVSSDSPVKVTCGDEKRSIELGVRDDGEKINLGPVDWCMAGDQPFVFHPSKTSRGDGVKASGSLVRSTRPLKSCFIHTTRITLERVNKNLYKVPGEMGGFITYCEGPDGRTVSMK